MLAYIPGTIMKNTNIMINTLNTAVAIFLPLDLHFPFQFRWNQNSTVTPHVNHDSNNDDDMLSSELNTGIAFARIQTTIQNRVTEKIHTDQSIVLLVSGTTSEDRRPRDGSDAIDERRTAPSFPAPLFMKLLTCRMKNTCRYRADVIPKINPVPRSPINDTAYDTFAIVICSDPIAGDATCSPESAYTTLATIT